MHIHVLGLLDLPGSGADVCSYSFEENLLSLIICQTAVSSYE